MTLKKTILCNDVLVQQRKKRKLEMAYKNDGKHITQRNLFMVIAFNT